MTPDLLTCEETFARLDDYLDRALDADDLRRVLAHIETCAECAAEYQFEERVIDDIRGKLQRMELPDGVMTRLSARLSAQLSAAPSTDPAGLDRGEDV